MKYDYLIDEIKQKINSTKFTHNQKKEIDEVIRYLDLMCDHLERDEEEGPEPPKPPLDGFSMDELIKEIQRRGPFCCGPAGG